MKKINRQIGSVEAQTRDPQKEPNTLTTEPPRYMYMYIVA